MATSGTYAFTMTATDMAQAALRQTGRFAVGDTIPAANITNVLQALNIIIKSMVKNQKPLWCIQRLTVPLIAGSASYNIATIAGMPRPPRVLFCFIRDSAGNDTEIALTARNDYSQLGQKSSQGTPNQGYYDAQLTGASFTVYNVPADSTHTLFIDIQRQIQDMTNLTDNFDFPQEAYHMLKWTLADEIALEYVTPADIRADIKAKAIATYDAFFADEREDVSTTFSPSARGQE